MLTQCIEQPGGVLAYIDSDGSDFLFASDDIKIIALRVGEVAGAIGNNYLRALCVDWAGYLRVRGFRAALVCRAIVLHRREGFLYNGGRMGCCVAGSPARCFFPDVPGTGEVVERFCVPLFAFEGEGVVGNLF
ncbi:hypothetical protein TNCV_3447871 [Trichonephila clavipes]|nr:hypothetical protein TNCV_3447871 [Trichonephila clavipes]